MARIEFEPSGKILHANPQFCAAMGYDLSEIKGQHHSIFVFPDEKSSQEYAQHWTRLQSGELLNGEFRRMSKTGEAVFIYASNMPIKSSAGQVYKVVKCANDITRPD